MAARSAESARRFTDTPKAAKWLKSGHKSRSSNSTNAKTEASFNWGGRHTVSAEVAEDVRVHASKALINNPTGRGGPER